ncbi:MAG TPA: hypothetical protein PLL71_08045 [Agriterribacter sp.]|nr:hypothetical protein [Agriterribacter sp.]HRQ52275.1 hypothetical protein [Agriterribacter sp.]
MLTIEKKSLKVGKYVSTKHVDTVIKTYKQERWVHNSERIGKEDSLSVWYSIEELEEFMATAKENGADGIKFYFAAYPETYTEKAGFAGRQTLVLVATKTKELETGVANKDIYIRDGEKAEILAYNAGNICPPLCNPKPKPTGADDWGNIGVTIVDRGEKGLTVV